MIQQSINGNYSVSMNNVNNRSLQNNNNHRYDQQQNNSYNRQQLNLYNNRQQVNNIVPTFAPVLQQKVAYQQNRGYVNVQNRVDINSNNNRYMGKGQDYD